jgi:hypothetical protein
MGTASEYGNQKSGAFTRGAAFLYIRLKNFFLLVFYFFFVFRLAVFLPANSLFKVFNSLPKTLADIGKLASAENNQHYNKYNYHFRHADAKHSISFENFFLLKDIPAEVKLQAKMPAEKRRCCGNIQHTASAFVNYIEFSHISLYILL